MTLWSRVHAHFACRRWRTRFKRTTAISGIEAPESTWLPIVSRDEQEGCYWQAGCRVGREAPVSGRCGIIYDITNEASKSGFGHPGCGGKEQDIAVEIHAGTEQLAYHARGSKAQAAFTRILPAVTTLPRRIAAGR